MNDKYLRLLKRIVYGCKRYFLYRIPLPLRVVNWLAIFLFVMAFMSLLNYNMLTSTIFFTAGIQVLAIAIIAVFFYRKWVYNKKRR